MDKENRAKQHMVSTTGLKSIAIRQQEYVEIDQIVVGHSTDDFENIVNANENQILT
ncbi:hypothetical protein Taro_049493, partial [Colocasia esculenta]|nr:hypothetical protein [Colocasia esculenta]